jgi:hypothetical protein
VKNLKKTLLTRFLALLVGSVFFTSLITYIFIKSFLVEKNIDVVELNMLYLILIPIFLLSILVSFYFYKRVVQRLFDDISEITQYLKEISNKNYEKVIRIKYFEDFLAISLLLKNLIKRVNQKDKKSSKK